MNWFTVNTDDEAIHLKVKSKRWRRGWEAVVPWSSISRVCFHAEDLGTSDGIYIFTSLRSESWVVPIEAVGGGALWDEIIRRQLFDAELAIEAAGAVGETFCWPSLDDADA